MNSRFCLKPVFDLRYPRTGPNLDLEKQLLDHGAFVDVGVKPGQSVEKDDFL